MCSSLKQLNTNTNTAPSSSEETKTMDCLTGVIGSEYTFSVLLEFAADNDVEGFQRSINDVSLVGEIGLWYGHRKCSKHIVVEHRTPLMIAAKYGSVEVVELILSLSEVDVNLSCGADKSTALHFAASGGSIRAAEVVKLLLLASADPCITDANGHYPFDVIVASWNMPQIRVALGELLNKDGPVSLEGSRESTLSFDSGSSSLSPSLGRGSSSLVSNAKISVVTCKPTDNIVPSAPKRKEYPVDPSIPDIKSSIYCTDEFRMFSFKIQPCSRAYSHAWTECPFVHPDENARRRDPRKFHYCGVPCLDFRKGTCKRGDLCEYAHGVFESWLHPAQYRTRICKDGTTCTRRVCFFAHRPEDMRPLYVSFGSGIQSRQSAASIVTTMDNAAAMNLLPDSPTALSAMSMLSPLSPAMSPSANVVSRAPMVWPQHVPPLHLPRSNLQGSRLRSSLNARDMPAMEPNMPKDFVMHQQQHLNNLSCLSEPHLATKPPNLDELFSTEVSSPRISPWKMGPSSTNFEQQQQSFCSLSPRVLGYNLPTNLESKGVVGFPVNTWSKWETLNGKVEWPAQENELGQYCKACSTGHHGVEPAVSLVQSLEMESPSSVQTTAAASNSIVSVEGSNSNSHSQLSDQAIFLAWGEQLQLDEIMA